MIRKVTTNQPKKPWFKNGWTQADLDELEWINSESEELQRRIALRDKRMEALNKKIQHQRETGFLAA